MGINTVTNERQRLAHGIEILAQEFLAVSDQQQRTNLQFAKEIKPFSTFQLIVILSIVAENVGEAKSKQDAELRTLEGWRDALLEELSDRV